MVITNPAEQLRGLPGPTEPNYQNKPATTTCRAERERQGGGGGVGGKKKERGYEAGERFKEAETPGI